jgi:GT2 family glycosyltransferase
MTVFVIIVTFNAMNWIEKCLKGLQYSSVKLTTYVIDNNSTDETITFIKNNFQEVRIVRNSQNLGFGKANNIGLRIAMARKFDYVFLLNQDVYLMADTIEKLVAIHKANPRYGIISPIHLDSTAKELDKNFSTYIPFNSLSELNYANSDYPLLQETNFVNAAAWLLSKECILKVGGFDPLFNHYGEDRDYCYRATYHGLTIGVATNTTIIHDRSYTLNNNYRKVRNTLLTMALAHIKNINYSLGWNYYSWFVLQIREMVKALLKIDIVMFYYLIINIVKMTVMLKVINQSRFLGKRNNCTYL